jgi:hypothetical protein
MINEWKKAYVVNAIMIFDAFDWRICSVSLPLCTSWLCRQNIIFICDGNVHTDHDTLHRNLPLYVMKKQNKNSSLLIGLGFGLEEDRQRFCVS